MADLDDANTATTISPVMRVVPMWMTCLSAVVVAIVAPICGQLARSWLGAPAMSREGVVGVALLGAGVVGVYCRPVLQAAPHRVRLPEAAATIAFVILGGLGVGLVLASVT